MTDTPFSLLREWLPANDDPARPTMSLATTGSDGYPDARTVLLSEVGGVGREGIAFHTEARSRKVTQLAADPRACVTLLLDGPRQVVLRGDVVVQDAEEQLRAYRRRSRYLQVLSWINTQELAQEPIEVRQAAWREFEERNPGELTPPETWVGYWLRPQRVTFWFADTEGPSTRLEFERLGTSWSTRRLPG